MKLNKLFIAAAIACAVLAGCKEKTSPSLPRGNASEALTAAVDSCLAAAERTMDNPVPYYRLEMHSIMVLQHGEVLYEKWMNGASADSVHILNSVSKTFTSLAVGMAIDEGLLSLDDKLVDFFPEKLPENPDTNLVEITVKDLLTMTCGHDDDHTRDVRSGEGDWAEQFLALPVEHKPGTFFVYNTIGTYMLSAIVQKVTGQKVVDYLTPRLFEPLCIDTPHWEESPQGINCGGWGLYLKTEDLAKVGQMILQKGLWNGKQLVSSSYIEQASSRQTYSLPSMVREEMLDQIGMTPENSDWLQGYGFQMWRCRNNAFRADGAAGQYIIVIPEKDAVVVTTANTNDMQDEINLIWKYILPAL